MVSSSPPGCPSWPRRWCRPRSARPWISPSSPSAGWSPWSRCSHFPQFCKPAKHCKIYNIGKLGANEPVGQWDISRCQFLWPTLPVLIDRENYILCRHKYVQFYVEVAGSKLNIGIVCINNVEASLSRSLQNISYCKLWFVLVKVALLWWRWWRFSRLPLIFQSDCFNWHHLDNPRARSQVLRIGR